VKLPLINGVSLPFIPAGGLSELSKKTPFTPKTGNGESFSEVFDKELTSLKFSGHAQNRMQSRDLDMTVSEVFKLEEAVSKAQAKGGNETLVLMNDKAFIVSIKNQTVITVMNREQLNSNVITNIDSAVFA
jgi:flagellar operon protein